MSGLFKRLTLLYGIILAELNLDSCPDDLRRNYSLCKVSRLNCELEVCAVVELGIPENQTEMLKKLLHRDAEYPFWKIYLLWVQLVLYPAALLVDWFHC